MNSFISKGKNFFCLKPNDPNTKGHRNFDRLEMKYGNMVLLTKHFSETPSAGNRSQIDCQRFDFDGCYSLSNNAENKDTYDYSTSYENPLLSSVICSSLLGINCSVGLLGQNYTDNNSILFQDYGMNDNSIGFLPSLFTKLFDMLKDTITKDGLHRHSYSVKIKVCEILGDSINDLFETDASKANPTLSPLPNDSGNTRLKGYKIDNLTGRYIHDSESALLLIKHAYLQQSGSVLIPSSVSNFINPRKIPALGTLGHTFIIIEIEQVLFSIELTKPILRKSEIEIINFITLETIQYAKNPKALFQYNSLGIAPITELVDMAITFDKTLKKPITYTKYMNASLTIENWINKQVLGPQQERNEKLFQKCAKSFQFLKYVVKQYRKRTLLNLPKLAEVRILNNDTDENTNEKPRSSIRDDRLDEKRIIEVPYEDMTITKLIMKHLESDWNVHFVTTLSKDYEALEDILRFTSNFNIISNQVRKNEVVLEPHNMVTIVQRHRTILSRLQRLVVDPATAPLSSPQSQHSKIPSSPAEKLHEALSIIEEEAVELSKAKSFLKSARLISAQQPNHYTISRVLHDILEQIQTHYIARRITIEEFHKVKRFQPRFVLNDNISSNSINIYFEDFINYLELNVTSLPSLSHQKDLTIGIYTELYDQLRSFNIFLPDDPTYRLINNTIHVLHDDKDEDFNLKERQTKRFKLPSDDVPRKDKKAYRGRDQDFVKQGIEDLIRDRNKSRYGKENLGLIWTPPGEGKRGVGRGLTLDESFLKGSFLRHAYYLPSHHLHPSNTNFEGDIKQNQPVNIEEVYNDINEPVNTSEAQVEQIDGIIVDRVDEDNRGERGKTSRPASAKKLLDVVEDEGSRTSPYGSEDDDDDDDSNGMDFDPKTMLPEEHGNHDLLSQRTDLSPTTHFSVTISNVPTHKNDMHNSSDSLSNTLSPIHKETLDSPDPVHHFKRMNSIKSFYSSPSKSYEKYKTEESSTPDKMAVAEKYEITNGKKSVGIGKSVRKDVPNFMSIVHLTSSGLKPHKMIPKRTQDYQESKRNDRIAIRNRDLFTNGPNKKTSETLRPKSASAASRSKSNSVNNQKLIKERVVTFQNHYEIDGELIPESKHIVASAYSSYQRGCHAARPSSAAPKLRGNFPASDKLTDKGGDRENEQELFLNSRRSTITSLDDSVDSNRYVTLSKSRNELTVDKGRGQLGIPVVSSDKVIKLEKLSDSFNKQNEPVDENRGDNIPLGEQQPHTDGTRNLNHGNIVPFFPYYKPAAHKPWVREQQSQADGKDSVSNNAITVKKSQGLDSTIPANSNRPTLSSFDGGVPVIIEANISQRDGKTTANELNDSINNQRLGSEKSFTQPTFSSKKMFELVYRASDPIADDIRQKKQEERRRKAVNELLSAIAKDDINMSEKLLMKNASIVSGKNGFGRDAMQIAVKQGNIQMLDMLFEKGGSVLTIGSSGDSLLHIASAYGHVSVLLWLVAHGLSKETVDMYGQNAVHVAARHFKLDSLKFLYSIGFNFGLRDRYQMSPLDYVSEDVSESSKSIILFIKKVLKKQGTNVVVTETSEKV